MIIPIPAAGQYGIITDQPHNELPLNAWTNGRNIRFRKGAAEKFSGETRVFGTPLINPEWLLPVNIGGSSVWLYAGSTMVGATNGSLHADISKVGGYTANPDVGWSGTVIEGIPVITNGIQPPQQWWPAGLTTKLTDLAAWPVNTTANFMAQLKRYLVALDITKGGVRYPHMVKWSHQAKTGLVPASWDETVETLDAAEYTLPDEGGYLVEANPLRDVLILYKEYQTWQMQYVGGVDVFRLTKLFDSIGALSRRCSIEFFSGKHAVFTGDDVIQHDGHEAQSLLNERDHDLLLNLLDPGGFKYCFVTADYRNKELWVGLPEPGQAFCTKAMVWNWTNNIWGVRDLPGVLHGASGIVNEIATDESWDSDPQAWEDDSSAWGDRTSDPSKRKLLLAAKGDNSLIVPGIGQQFQGENMISSVERQGLGFPTKHPAPPDYTRMKQVLNLWPRVTGSEGGVINVSLGIQSKIGAQVDWKETIAFRIGESESCDFSGVEASRIHAVKFESNSNINWRLHGYDVDVVDRGNY